MNNLLSDIDLAIDGLDELLTGELIHCNYYIVDAIEKGKNPVLTHMASRLKYYAGQGVSRERFPKYDMDEVVIAKKCLLELQNALKESVSIGDALKNKDSSNLLKFNAELAHRVDKGKNLCYAYAKMHLENSRYKLITRDAFVNRLVVK